ncbi:MAG: beta-galactosidase [Sphingobacteriia bacterium]|nr:beta-galactosidase [Sphingobacteriia bacterium]
MRKLFYIIIFIASCLTGYAQPHSFEIKNGRFLLDNKIFTIRAGEMHYARIPKAYWKQRLLMLKAMGLNTVSTYVFWNYHHPTPASWDFTTDNHDIRGFLSLAKELGLYVILRPGPYVCAEWEFGGFPWWLSSVKGLEIRTNNKAFLDSCKIYFQQLSTQIKGMHISEGGPVILTQVENEFGSYAVQRKDIPLATHLQYIQSIKSMLDATGFKPPFYTADGRTLFAGGHVQGVLPAANGEDNIDSLKASVNKFNGGNGPYFIGEFYPGWLDHWAEPFEKVSTAKVVAQTEKYLKDSISFSFYMAHGGTNFAYTAGANYTREHPIQPDITSYDYDAPVSEAGWATDKYIAIRNLMQQYMKEPLPAIPNHEKTITINPVAVDKTIDLFEWKKSIRPVLAEKPLSFEELHQGYGYVLYSIKMDKAAEGVLKINGLRDFATIYVNGKRVAELDYYFNRMQATISIPQNATLDILVENMGRINYGAKITESLKGILSPVFINEAPVKGVWHMYKMPLETPPKLSNYASKIVATGSPVFYTASFPLTETGDMFMNMQYWGKGIVFVNGHHLGRFWNVGPQQTLYVPGCWLKKGRNEIIVFDQLNDTIQQYLSFKDHPVLDSLHK